MAEANLLEQAMREAVTMGYLCASFSLPIHFYAPPHTVFHKKTTPYFIVHNFGKC